MYYPLAGISRITPAAFEFPIKDTNQEYQVTDIVKKTVVEKNVVLKKTSLIQATSSNGILPFEYSVNEKNTFDLISKSDYMNLIQLQGKKVSIKNLSGNDCTLVKYQYDKENIDIGNVYTLNLTHEDRKSVV